MLTGRLLTAEEALEIGFLNEVVPPEQLDQAVSRLAALLDEAGSGNLRRALEMVAAASNNPLTISV